MLEAHPTFVRAKSSARQFVLGPILPVREEGLRGLNLTGFALDIAHKVIVVDDWGPRVAGLQAAATHHAQMREGDGIMAAGISVVVRELFDKAAELAPEEIRGIARQAIASVATDFSYGVLRTSFGDAAIAWANELTPQLSRWGKTDAALTVETLAAEALYTMNHFDEAIARLPRTGPSDPAGSLRYARMKRLIDDLDPGGAGPKSPAAQYEEALEALKSLHETIPNTLAYAAMREKIGSRLKAETDSGPPGTEAELLNRAVSLGKFLATAKGLATGAF
jgi:tetratricopeptide (TPR) repeat protein